MGKTIFIILSSLLIAFLCFVGEAISEGEATAPDYLMLKVGNRWVLEVDKNEKWTFEIEEKIADGQYKVLLSRSGMEESGRAVWKLDGGFFVMEMKEGAPSKVLKLPVTKGEKWEFATSRGQVCACETVGVGALDLAVGKLEDCVVSSLNIEVDGAKILTNYLFSAGFGLAGIESYVDGKLQSKALAVEARLDGVVYNAANRFAPAGKGVTEQAEPKEESVEIDVESEKKAAKLAFEKAVQKFLSKDFEGFYGCFSEEFQSRVKYVDFAKGLLEDFESASQIISKLVVIDVTIKTEDGISAEIRARVEGTEDSEDTVILVKEGDQWKILDLR